MKIIIIAFLIFLSGCQFEKSSDDKAVKQRNKVEKKEVTIEKSSFDFITSKTTSLNSTLDVEKIDENKLITFSKEFLKNHISPVNIKVGFPKNLPSEYPQSYLFYQSKEYSDFNLFTFLYKDETCCTTLYGATVEKDKLKIIDIGVLAYTGGDGGWNGILKGKWKDDYHVQVMEESVYDDDLDQETNNSEIDSTWLELSITKSGKFKSKNSKKVSYKGDEKQ